MKHYFKKYAILLIVLVLLQSLLKFLRIAYVQPYLLNRSLNHEEINNLMCMLGYYLAYLTNIVLVFFILADLMKHKIKALPVVLLTLLSHFIGVIFFLLLINTKVSGHDK